MNHFYINWINWIIMGNQQQMSPAEREAWSLAYSNFRREGNGSSAVHIYDLRTFWLIQKEDVFMTTIFPQSLGEWWITKANSKQRRTSNCCWVTVGKCRYKLHWRKGVRRPHQNQPQQTDCSQLRFLNGKLEDNRIGDKGCEHLAKGVWPQLK